MANLDEISRFIQIPSRARRLLEWPEKEVRLTLSMRLSEDRFIQTNVFLVYHNTARGPAKGGLRFAPDITLDQTRQLAELMTWKTALTRVPFGGGKSALSVDSQSLSRQERVVLLKELVHLIRAELDTGAYIPAPDLGTNAADMAIIYGETHRAESVTGKPPSLGGLPGRRQSTGRGVARTAVLSLARFLKMDAPGASVAIQGFGNVGSWAAHFLSKSGLRVVAVSDINGGVYRDSGLDIQLLMKWVQEGNSVADFKEGSKISNEDLLHLPVDVLIPAACENVLTEKTAAGVNAKMVVEGANAPTTAEGDSVLLDRGVVVVPDILANAGGVIASYVEWMKAKSGALTRESETYQVVDELIEESLLEVAAFSREKKVPLRLAAQVLAVSEVVRAMDERGWL